MTVSSGVFAVQMARLLDTFHAGAPHDRYAGLLDEYEQAYAGQERMTDAAFTLAVTEALRHFTTMPLPARAEFGAVAEWAILEMEHRKALPAPAVVPSSKPANFAWHVAIGRARMRKRRGLIEAYRAAEGLPVNAAVPEEVWHGLDEPTDAEVEAVMNEAGRAVVTAAGPVPVLSEGEWPR